jgi:cell division protein FtsB
MNFIKVIVGLPIIILIVVFAFGNNSSSSVVDLGFDLFGLNIMARLDLAVILLVIFGYIMGRVDAWISYAPLRRTLRAQLKQNKKLSQQQQKLSEEVQGLKGTIENSKSGLEHIEINNNSKSKISETKEKIKGWFGKKNNPEPKEDDYW